LPSRIDREQSAAVRSGHIDGWRGIVLVAGTYVYFLIFAQFGFLKRLAQLGFSADHLKAIMAAMAAGGILASLLAPRVPWLRAPKLRLQAAFFGCGLAAVLTLLPLNLAGCVGVAFLIGISLGTLTVTLVSYLALWIGGRYPLLKIALGTGLGYWICNVPALFTATPQGIAMAAVLAALLCILVANRTLDPEEKEPLAANPGNQIRFGVVLLWFTALIWFDSAAFFIIQNSPALKSGTWEGAAHLWRTGAIHFVGALASAWLLARRGLAATLLTAFALLAAACLFLLYPAHSAAASILYPLGVSMYSVALVAYPSYLLAIAEKMRTGRAGWIYAIAGWAGSAMGIGMAQNLHRVPVAFIAAAALVFLVPLLWRAGMRAAMRSWREAAAVILVCAVSWGVHRWIVRAHPAPLAAHLTPAERGRRVYIAEGCIHCHSQYVRPHSPDVLMWGPAGNVEAIRREDPPLIGNRRQGPDLTNVGSRRSLLWLRIHQMNPRAVSPDSVMPSYAYLFQTQRGDDLLAYLASLRSPDSAEHLKEQIASWEPSRRSVMEARQFDGAKLFREYCATCHAADGAVRQKWGADFKTLPPDLATAPLLPQASSPTLRQNLIAKIIKFGIPGTSMAGHEYLPDAQVEAIARWVMSTRRDCPGSLSQEIRKGRECQ
jgi:cbb3-type cytochrome oxidase cytochrome c subunit